MMVLSAMLSSAITKLHANVNAINFDKIKYPAELAQDISFLRNNEPVYDHWVHDWVSDRPKADVVKRLSFLYSELGKLPADNVETALLIGDIAHYLYNMENEEYYQKAIDHYNAAMQLSPKDYRVYWFLGNHYALSAVALSSIKNYNLALQYLPRTAPSAFFWADYAVACSNASMPATALYAAQQSSKLTGAKTHIEEQVSVFKDGVLKAPPTDTILPGKDAWRVSGKRDGRVLITNWAAGVKIAVDSSWSFQPGDYKNGTTYAIIQPHQAIAKNGRKIGYNILVFAQMAKENQTLKQYLDMFTSKYPDRKNVSFDVGEIKNCLAYEIKDPSMYTDIGGGHLFAIALERSRPEYPGMALEEVVEIPAGDGKLNYYTSTRTYSRFNGKIYYLILLDSCEFIHEESLTNLKKVLDKGIIIE